MATERNALLSLLRSLSGVMFVEPGHELVMQDEVHDQARELRRERGLSADHPYIGWHTQAEAFNAKGAQTRPQLVYFGGDPGTVGAALQQVHSLGLTVLGGRSEQEAFAILRDATPTAADPAQQQEWSTRLAVLGNDLMAPLRDGEERLLHEVLASDDLAANHPAAVRALRLRNLLTEADFDRAFAPETLKRLEQHYAGRSGSELAPTVLAAFDAGYPRAAEVTAMLAREGRATGEMLAAWGGPEARQAARDRVLATGQGSDIATYITLVQATGGDRFAAVLDLAERLRTHAGEQAAQETVFPLVRSYPGERGSVDLQAMRDERIPLWLRVLVAEDATRLYGTRSPAQAEAALARSTRGVGLTAEEVVALDAEIDAVRLAAGLDPSPGFELSDVSKFGSATLNAVVENREYMLAAHRDGLVAAVQREDLDEPTIAVILEVLVPAGALPAEALDALATRWRTLFVTPGTYTPAPPALLTLAVACLAAGHAEGPKIVAAVRKDRRKWTDPLKYALLGAVDEGREADLAAEALLTPVAFSTAVHGSGRGEAQWALVAVRARLRGITPELAAGQLVLESPERPSYIGRSFVLAMMATMEPGSGLLGEHDFREWSAVALAAALSLANAPLPPVIRRYALDHAEHSSVLQSPERAAVEPLPEQIAELTALRESARAALA